MNQVFIITDTYFFLLMLLVALARLKNASAELSVKHPQSDLRLRSFESQCTINI